MPEDLVSQELARMRLAEEREAAWQAARRPELERQAARQREQEAAQQAEAAKAKAAAAEATALFQQFLAWARLHKVQPDYDRVITVPGRRPYTRKRFRVRGWTLETGSGNPRKIWYDGEAGSELVSASTVLTTDGDIVFVRVTKWHSGSSGSVPSPTTDVARGNYESPERAAQAIADIVARSGRNWP